jgi:hypothetical protein
LSNQITIKPRELEPVASLPMLYSITGVSVRQQSVTHHESSPSSRAPLSVSLVRLFILLFFFLLLRSISSASLALLHASLVIPTGLPPTPPAEAPLLAGRDRGSCICCCCFFCRFRSALLRKVRCCCCCPACSAWCDCSSGSDASGRASAGCAAFADAGRTPGSRAFAAARSDTTAGLRISDRKSARKAAAAGEVPLVAVGSTSSSSSASTRVRLNLCDAFVRPKSAAVTPLLAIERLWCVWVCSWLFNTRVLLRRHTIAIS